MARERTLSIIKPDAVQKNLIGEIEACIEKAGLLIVAVKMMRMSRVQARDFYEIHQDKPFYDDLVKFMTSGPMLVQVLEGAEAITCYRGVMGTTTFGSAVPGTIRAKFATSTTKNAVHGSDCKKNAKREINFFFAEHEIFSRS